MRNNITISNYFYKDAIDFIHRFDVCYKIADSKSMRAKNFIDLRMALECVLKSIICYYRYSEFDEAEIVKKLKKSGHKIDELIDCANEYLQNSEKKFIKEGAPFLDNIFTVSMRYSMDSSTQYKKANHLYNNKIINDDWICQLKEQIETILKNLNATLQKHSKMIPMSEINIGND